MKLWTFSSGDSTPEHENWCEPYIILADLTFKISNRERAGSTLNKHSLQVLRFEAIPAKQTAKYRPAQPCTGLSPLTYVKKKEKRETLTTFPWLLKCSRSQG